MNKTNVDNTLLFTSNFFISYSEYLKSNNISELEEKVCVDLTYIKDYVSNLEIDKLMKFFNIPEKYKSIIPDSDNRVIEVYQVACDKTRDIALVVVKLKITYDNDDIKE